MFARLKKKIENEGGAGANSDTASKSSGRRDSVTSLPRAGSIQHLGPSPPGSVTSEDTSMRDLPSSARDEMTILLQKKAEQCKKLEGNISDLAALVKEKNKTIEKLETSLKQQDEVTNKKLQEQKEEFEKYRDKLIEGYQDDKLKMDKLLNTEEALTSCRAELETRTRQCQAAEAQVEKLTDELGPLKQRLTVLEAENTKLKEENSERAELVTSLTKDRSAFDKRLDEMNKEMVEKQSQLSRIESQLADLDSQHKTLIRNSDLQRNKTSKLLEEKDDHIDTLQERVKTLEQRISDSSLSGDDRLSALQVERETLEQKLAETRQQLTEVKSTWSDKITHLEEQISHLNAKIVEDSEELASNQKLTEQMRESFHRQIDDLKAKLEDAEKRALENLELASSKESHYEKQIEALESDLSRQKLDSVDSDTQLRAKITSLEAQIRDLDTARVAERDEAKSRISHLEEKASQFTDKEVKYELQVNNLEVTISKLQVSKLRFREKDDRLTALQQQVEDRDLAGSDKTSTISSLQQQLSEMEKEVEAAHKARDDFEKHLRSSEEEKGGLLERNADLLKQMQTLKSSHSDAKAELQRSLELKSHSIETLQKSEAGLRQKLDSLEQQIEQNEISKAESGLYSERIDEMKSTISSLQNQLAEKTRTVKKQEQTLKDLRVTLQRELKVQSLPNDETAETTANSNSSTSPSMSRRYGAESRLSPRPQDQQSQSLDNYNQSHFSRSGASGSYTNPTAAVLPVQASSSIMTSMTATSSSVPSGAMDALTIHTAHVKKELDKDVNFQYLKHVVLKFMLSRESEAIQLIKAVSMLLNFTTQEQKLIKDTLEWKRSWFGHRPPLGKGQNAKVIPPTL